MCHEKLLCLVLLALHGAAADPTFCQGKQDGLHAHPGDCSKFYTCHVGITYEQTCGASLMFNPGIQSCDFPRNVNCQPGGVRTPTAAGFCHGKTDGLHAHPGDCTKYYNCHNGNGHATLCPSGTLYNTDRLYCDWEDNVMCLDDGGVTATEAPGFCTGKTDGLYSHPVDCNKYYECYHSGTTAEMSCPSGLLFNPVLNVCDWPQNVDCNAGVPTAAPTAAPTMAPTATPPTTAEPTQAPPTGGPCQRRVCYHTNWSQYRNGAGKFLPADLDPFLCTHIMYSFANLVNNHLMPFEWNDESTDFRVGHYKQVTDLKVENPQLKVLLAVGGWTMSSGPFTTMVASPESRAEFIATSIDFLRQHNFDGLDLDWEYPASRGSPPEDRGRFTALVQELRAAFVADGIDTGLETLLLTAAVAAGKEIIDVAYDIPAISNELDFINLMSYDLHGAWEGVTGHNSPLYVGEHETGDTRRMNVDWAAQYWVSQGCPPNKLVIGLPLYARTFTLSTGSSTVGSPATVGHMAPFTESEGFAAYYEVCAMQRDGATENFLSDQRVPYLVYRDQWVGYDSPSSLREKVQYIRSNGFGGSMVWTMDLDDFDGSFCNEGRYPLLSAIRDECSL